MDRDRRLSPAPGWAAVVLAGAVLILVTLVALGARGLPGQETRPPPLFLEIDLVVVTRILLSILAGFGALLLILLLMPGGPAVKLPNRKKKSSPLKLLAAIVLVFALLVILQPFGGEPNQEAEPAGTGEVATEIDARGLQLPGSGWGLVLLGGAVLLLVWGVAAATRPPPPAELPAEPLEPAPVTDAIDAVLADLEDSVDPRRVVIGAYARMERALTLAGLPRRSSEAPLEYLARALRRLSVSRAAIVRLTSLFEEARFSEHQIHEEMAQAAVGALQDIRSELSGVPS